MHVVAKIITVGLIAAILSPAAAAQRRVYVDGGRRGVLILTDPSVGAEVGPEKVVMTRGYHPQVERQPGHQRRQQQTTDREAVAEYAKAAVRCLKAGKTHAALTFARAVATALVHEGLAR